MQILERYRTCQCHSRASALVCPKQRGDGYTSGYL